MSIKFTIPAVPVAQPRAKATTINGKARMYGAKKSHPIHDFKASCRLAFSQATSAPPLDGPVAITVLFIMPRPKSMCWKTKPNPRVRHTKKPDLDNLIKGLKDALKGLAWRDDSQVCRCFDEKWIASGDEQPHVEVTIGSLSNPTN